jgi:hypothetical protein
MGTDHRPEPTVCPNQAPGAWDSGMGALLPGQAGRRALPTLRQSREDRPVGRAAMVQP